MKRFLSLVAIALALTVVFVGCQQAPKVLKVAVLAPSPARSPHSVFPRVTAPCLPSMSGTRKVAFSA